MAGPEPRVPYNPTQEVAPEVGSPSNYIRTQASPQAFGSSIGQATQGLGKTEEALANPAVDYAVKRQGQLNEASAVNGETDTNISYGQIFDQLKSKKGLAAAQAVPQAVEQIRQVRQKVREQMPNDAAAKAYDMMIARTEGFVIRDMYSYGDTEQKGWHTQVLNSNKDMFVDRAGRSELVSNPTAWHENLHQVLATSAAVFDDTTHLSETGLLTFNEQGEPSFKDTPDGRNAKVVFDDYMNKQVSAAYKNKYKTLLDDPNTGNAKTAVDLFEQEKDQIPSVARADISASLIGPYRSMIMTSAVNDEIKKEDADYQGTMSPSYAPTTDNDSVYQAIKRNEGGPKSNVMQIKSNAVWSKYSKSGEFVTDPIANEAVAHRFIDDLMKKYHNDGNKVAVAYFSGEDNVNEDGPVPYKDNFKSHNLNPVNPSVSEYLDRFQRGTHGSELGTSPFVSKADYLRAHGGEHVDAAMKRIEELFPDHPELAWQAGQKMEQHINREMQDETRQDRVAFDKVWDFIGDRSKKGAPLSTVAELDTAPPEISEAWKRVNRSNPYQANSLFNRLANANVRGKAPSYGTDFYNKFQDVVNGKITDPLVLGQSLGSGVTNTGFEQLKGLLDHQGDPTKKNFSKAMLEFYSKTRDQLVTSYPGDITDVDGELKFNQFMQASLPEIKSRQQKGENVDMFNPESKDTMFNYITPFLRSPAEITKSFNDAMNFKMSQGIAAAGKRGIFNPNSLNGLNEDQTISKISEAVTAGQLSPAQADGLVKQHGIVQ